MKASMLAMLPLIALFGCATPDTSDRATTATDVIETIRSIKPGMPKADLDKLFTTRHRGCKYVPGLWSGSMGYFTYSLQDQRIVSVSGYNDTDGNLYVHKAPMFYIQRRPGAKMIEITVGK